MKRIQIDRVYRRYYRLNRTVVVCVAVIAAIFVVAFIVFAVVVVAVFMAFMAFISPSKANTSILMLCAVLSLGLWPWMVLVWDNSATDTLRLKQQQQQRQSCVNGLGQESNNATIQS